MIAADDGNPITMAPIHPIRLRWQSAGGKDELYPSRSRIVSSAYYARGGEAPGLPGFRAQVSGRRADIRLAMDGRGELFIMSKSDGMIREVVGAADR
jgi:hypothetical protein